MHPINQETPEKLKIAYINGYKGENSNKPSILSELLGINIDHIKIEYNSKYLGDILKDVETSIETKKYDLIIASSTGAYLARYYCDKYNIPLVSINPIIDLNVLYKIAEEKEIVKIISNFVHKTNTAETAETTETEHLVEVILINEDDELISSNKTVEFCENNNIMYKLYKNGGHRFTNLSDVNESHKIAKDLKTFISYAILYVD